MSLWESLAISIGIWGNLCAEKLTTLTLSVFVETDSNYRINVCINQASNINLHEEVGKMTVRWIDRHSLYNLPID